MKLTIHGAARQVTGSMHLLEVGQYKILIDCGLDYEKDRSLQSNENFPFDPASIDVVILTHAHIDHSGNMPRLTKAVSITEKDTIILNSRCICKNM